MRLFARFQVIIFLMIAAVSGCAHSSEINSDENTLQSISAADETGALFIIGGGSRPESMMMRMVEEAEVGDDDLVIILPMSSSDPEASGERHVEEFTGYGLTNVHSIIFTEDNPPVASQLDSLRQAGMVYIPGGSQRRFMNTVRDTEVIDALYDLHHGGTLIGGTSAGAAVMSDKMITGTELRADEYYATFRRLEHNNIEIESGIGFLDSALIDQHFVWRARNNRLLTGILEFPHLLGIGIDESTAILVRGDQAEVVGESQVLVYRNPDESQYLGEDDKFGARSLRIDIYLDGEKFEISR